MMECHSSVCMGVLSRFSLFNSVWPYGLQPARFLCPRDSPCKNTRVGCHALLQGIFLTQGSNPRPLHLLHWRAGPSPRDGTCVSHVSCTGGRVLHPGMEPASLTSPALAGESFTQGWNPRLSRLLRWRAGPSPRDGTRVSHVSCTGGRVLHPGIEPASLASPALAGGSFNTSAPGKSTPVFTSCYLRLHLFRVILVFLLALKE